MEQVAHPYITAGVALAAASLVAVTPVTPSLPDVQVPDIQLSAIPGNPALDQPLDSGESPVDGLIGSHHAGIADPGNSIDAIVSGSPYQPALADIFDNIDATFRADLGALLGPLDGWLDPLAPGAVAGVDLVPFPFFQPGVGASQFGGVGGAEAASAQDVVASGEVSAFLGSISAAASQLFSTLLTDVQAFNDNLLAAESAFNIALISHELAMEEAVFGNDSALNGVVNRGFDALNMMFAAQEQSINSLLGAGDPTALLLSGAAGSAAGLQGAFDQNVAILGDIAGLQPDDFNNLFASFDGALFSTALQNFVGDLVGGPFGDLVSAALAPIFADVSDVIASIESVF